MNTDLTAETTYKLAIALRQHAIRGNTRRVRSIVREADELGERASVVDYQDEDGQTALHFAVMFGHWSVVRILVCEGGADLDIRKGNEHTALISACFFNRMSIVRFLVEKGASFDDETLLESRYANFNGQDAAPLSPRQRHSIKDAIRQGRRRKARRGRSIQSTLEDFHVPKVLGRMIAEYD